VDDEDLAQIADFLSALLRAVDAGELAATDVQRAYLQGAIDTVAALREGGGDGPT